MSLKKKIILGISLILITIIIICIIIVLNNKKEEVVEISDTTSPIIVLDDSYVVKTGYNKNLVDVIMSADDVDPNPKEK